MIGRVEDERVKVMREVTEITPTEGLRPDLLQVEVMVGVMTVMSRMTDEIDAGVRKMGRNVARQPNSVGLPPPLRRIRAIVTVYRAEVTMRKTRIKVVVVSEIDARSCNIKLKFLEL